MPKEEKQPIKQEDDFIQQVNAWLSRFQRISMSEKLFFIQHLGVMIKAGISLAKALEMLAKQTTNKRFKKIIYEIYKSVNKGDTLADALKPYGNVFDELFVNMIAAGEVSGTLEDVLKQLYLQLKKNHQLIGKIRGALLYPIIIFIAMSLIGTGVMIFVVPKFISIFEEVEMELPIMTQILITVSNYVSNNGFKVLIGLVLTLFIIIRILKAPRGKYWWHLFILKMPIISSIVVKINLARFSRTISSLLKTDIKIVESFKITAKTVSNVHYKKSLEDSAEKIKKGEPIYKILANYPSLYNHVIIQMIAVGEETGELDTILEEIADFYEEEVEEIMNTLPSIIEPLIIIVLAVCIGAMAAAIVMPMYSLTNAF